MKKSKKPSTRKTVEKNRRPKGKRPGVKIIGAYEIKRARRNAFNTAAEVAEKITKKGASKATAEKLVKQLQALAVKAMT